MVVDDDPVIQNLLEVNFEMEGYTVYVASDGLAGLEMARSRRPDVVVLDVMMPGMNGLEVARHLRDDADTADIPIIVVSAKAQESDLNAGRAAGVDDYVTKPFDPFELLERVARLLADDSQRPPGSPGEG